MSLGFFFVDDDAKGSKGKGKQKQLSFETMRHAGCSACPFDKLKNLAHPKMNATGAKYPLIYMLGEAPGATEDAEGEQFVGDSGDIVRPLIPEKYHRKIRWNNTINCRPPKNATPDRIHLECCRPRVQSDIEKSKPKAIFCFGGTALKWVTDEERITSFRGLCIPVKIGDHCTWLFPFMHPAALLRKRGGKGYGGSQRKSDDELIFERDLKRAFKMLKRLPDASVVEGEEITRGISYVTGANGWKDVRTVRRELKRLAKLKRVTFDYETASDEKTQQRQTRPYGDNARILSVSVGTKKRVLAFPILHREAKWSDAQLKAVIKAWLWFLKQQVRKTAHNLFFELEWTIFMFGLEYARACEWHDTMAQAYCMGMQKGTTSLDALTYIRFGFKLKSVSNMDLSNLDYTPIEDVLVYNALDTKWTDALFEVQNYVLEEEGLLDLYEDQVCRIPTVALKSHFGMLIDFGAVIDFDGKYSPKIEGLIDWFSRAKSIAKFEANQGKKFNPGSHDDALILFRDILKRSECRIKEKGKRDTFRWSADDSVLKKIPLKVSKKLQEYRAVTGNKSKYVDGLLPNDYQTSWTKKPKEIGRYIFPDGMTHAVIQTLFIVTRRSSCVFPNEQFWPKRNEGYSDLRRLFTSPNSKTRSKAKTFGYDLPSHVTEEDCWFLVIDYGQIQARIVGMVSNDELYCKYLWDRNDIHMRWTKKLARAYPKRIGGKKFLKDQDALKRFRTDVKNQWTFPLIFGATPESVSGYLSIPVDVIREMIDQFFDEMPGLKDYQRRMLKFYAKNGYVESPNGWRRYGPLAYGDIINTPIQSAEADIVFDAMNRLSVAAGELDMWQFQARLEIHDELGFWIPKKNFERDLEFISDHMLECSHYPWINVPLCIEISKGPNWFDAKEISTIYSDDLGKLDRKECGF